MELFKHHSPRTYPTIAGQLKRLRWMLKQCHAHKWIHLAALVEQQIGELE